MNNTKNSSGNKSQAMMLLAIMALLSLVVYWDFLTFTNLFLYKDIGSDTLNVFYPGYVHLADYLRSDGWPAWSFSRGMGQSVFPGGIAEPFNLFLFLLGSEHLAYGLAYVQVCKILLAGILFYLYLRLLSLVPMAAMTGALLYAFSGFMILGGTWYVFSAQAVYFALLLYAFERYLKERVWIFLPIVAALLAANTTFSLYVFAIFFLPYSIFRYYILHGWQPRELWPFLLRLLGLIVLGLGISAVFLFANLQEMMNSPRVLGDASLFGGLMNRSPMSFESYEHNITAIMRLFSSDLLGTGSDFRGWKNYLEAPMFYCGLLPLLMAPQVFVQLDRKHKIAYALFGLVFLIPVFLPFYRYLFWAFAGDYYRLYSAFVAFVFLFFSLHALNVIFKTGRVHIRLLIVTLVVLLTALFSPYFLGVGAKAEWVNGTVRLMITGLLLVYTALVIAVKSHKFRMPAQWGLLIVICLELASFSWQTVNDRPVVTTAEFGSKTGYNDYTTDAIAVIKTKDTGFYRIEKDYSSGPAVHTSLNDALVQGYFGTSSYHSFNQLNYIRFLDALEIIDAKREHSTRWATGILSNRFLTAFSSVKYVLIKQEDRVRRFMQRGYELFHIEGDVFVMLNPNYLPFGFTYDSYMTEEKFTPLSRLKKNMALMKTAVVRQDFDKSRSLQLAHINEAEIGSTFKEASYLADLEQRRNSILNISNFDHNHVKGEIALDHPKLLFFTLPFDRGWTATVDGEPAELLQVNIGFSGLLLSAGEHAIELRYRLPYFTVSLVITIISIICLICLVWRRRMKAAAVEI